MAKIISRIEDVETRVIKISEESITKKDLKSLRDVVETLEKEFRVVGAREGLDWGEPKNLIALYFKSEEAFEDYLGRIAPLGIPYSVTGLNAIVLNRDDYTNLGIKGDYQELHVSGRSDRGLRRPDPLTTEEGERRMRKAIEKWSGKLG